MLRKEDYPPDWPAISRAVRERAGQRCEWCKAPNGERGARDHFGEWHGETAINAMKSDYADTLFVGAYPHIIRIVLTVAHLGTSHADGRPGNKHDTMDCRPENLSALCQRCHLNYDRFDHIAHAHATRIRKQRAQQPLLLDVPF